MNFEQIEYQVDSVMHSLRQRVRRRSSLGPSPQASSPAQSVTLGSQVSSAAASPASLRGKGGHKGLLLRSSLRSPASLKRLMRGRFFGGDEPVEHGSRAGNGQQKASPELNSKPPSEENLAWTAPVSPQSQMRAQTPRRRNSARLRELQRLLRAYHEQREAWTSPPASPSGEPKRRDSNRSSSGRRQEEAVEVLRQTHVDLGAARADFGVANGTREELGPGRALSPAVPLQYSRAELGTQGHPLLFPAPQLGWPTPKSSPKKAAKKQPVVEATERISLSQLELSLRGSQQPEAVRIWSPGAGSQSSTSARSASSRGPSSSLSPASPQLLPKSPLKPASRWTSRDTGDQGAQYFRVESPRPAADVHFQTTAHIRTIEMCEQLPPLAVSNEEKKKKQKMAKEMKVKTTQQVMQQVKAQSGSGTTTSVFSPAGIQQLLFRHRQRGQSETRDRQKGREIDEPHSLALVKPARSEPRLARSALSGRPSSLGSSLAGLSLSQSTTALEHLDRLKDRVTETKYVTAVFESRGGIGPVLDDVQAELQHWLGTQSRLLTVACEVHWSVPERFRSRQLEIQLKECLHAALRENNRRILSVNNDEADSNNGLLEEYPGLDNNQSWLRSRPAPFPITLAKSRTEESCASDRDNDAFQGVYRRFYPALLSLQDAATVQAHKGYWAVENLGDNRLPLVPSPARFLYNPEQGQLARKSLVALNMAVLRLQGDNRDYDKTAPADDDQQRPKRKANKKKQSLKQSFF